MDYIFCRLSIKLGSYLPHQAEGPVESSGQNSPNKSLSSSVRMGRQLTGIGLSAERMSKVIIGTEDAEGSLNMLAALVQCM